MVVFYGSHIWVMAALRRHYGIAMRQQKRKCPPLPTVSVEEDLFGLASRSVGTGRDRSTSPPFGERCQAIVFFRHLEQAPLVLDRIRG